MDTDGERARSGTGGACPACGSVRIVWTDRTRGVRARGCLECCRSFAGGEDASVADSRPLPLVDALVGAARDCFVCPGCGRALRVTWSRRDELRACCTDCGHVLRDAGRSESDAQRPRPSGPPSKRTFIASDAGSRGTRQEWTAGPAA